MVELPLPLQRAGRGTPDPLSGWPMRSAGVQGRCRRRAYAPECCNGEREAQQRAMDRSEVPEPGCTGQLPQRADCAAQQARNTSKHAAHRLHYGRVLEPNKPWKFPRVPVGGREDGAPGGAPSHAADRSGRVLHTAARTDERLRCASASAGRAASSAVAAGASRRRRAWPAEAGGA